jgi:hypothetical protein
MRLNKNFANVYTPFHEMEDLELNLVERRKHRQDRKSGSLSRLEDPWEEETVPIVEDPFESKLSFEHLENFTGSIYMEVPDVPQLEIVPKMR